MDDDTTIDDAPWDPWKPEVGQRVRVHLSAECNGRVGLLMHVIEEDSRTGTVRTVEPWIFPDHPYHVYLDERVPATPAWDCAFSSNWYAAAELVPEDW